MSPLARPAASRNRVRIRLSVLYGEDAPELPGKVDNISEAGLFIRTNRTFRAGTAIVMLIEFPDRTVLQRGDVAWAIQVPEHMKDDLVCGMGVSFCGVDAAWPRFFRKWEEQVLAGA